MSVRPQGHTKGPSKTEIRQFQVAVLIDEKILRLEVAVEDAVGVAVPDALNQLAHELLDNVRPETQVLHIGIRERLATTALAHRQRLHVLLQVQVQILEDEVKLVSVGMDDVEQANNVGVVHLLEQGDFANGRAWNTLILGLETNLLEGNNALVLGCQIARFVNNSVGS